MSNQDDKMKNSTRRFRDETAIRRQLDIIKSKPWHSATTNKSIDEPHRLVKLKAMDCGNPKCFMCGNPRRSHKDKLTQQEKRIFQDIDTPSDKRGNGLENND